MGTSNANEGQGGRTPLVPSWLPDGPPLPLPPPPNQGPQPEPAPMPPVNAPETTSTPIGRPAVSSTVPIPPTLPATPEFGDADRFRTPRTNFTRFARSGGSDRGSLGRALSGYVST